MAVLTATAFARETPAKDTVLRVSAINTSGETVTVDDYDSFEDGWSAAMELASDSGRLNEQGYTRVVVDIYEDWVAESTVFGDTQSFRWGAIYVPENVSVTLNLNSNSINRGLGSTLFDGAVIFVEEDADLVINGGKDESDTAYGVITGGFNANGAGGINIDDGASVTLNNVKVEGNSVGGKSGGAIALYDGASLVMNGGTLSGNLVNPTYYAYDRATLASVLYVDGATAYLDGVTVSGNGSAGNAYVKGGVIAVLANSSVTLNETTVENNGCDNGSRFGSLFYTDSAASSITMIKSTVKNNSRSFSYLSDSDASVIFAGGGNLFMSGCTVTANKSYAIFGVAHCVNSVASLVDCDVKNNAAELFYVGGTDTAGNRISFDSCNFDANGSDPSRITFDVDGRLKIFLSDCDFGDSTFGDNENVSITNSISVGSMVGEGSITTIVSILALAVSLAAITMAVVNKEKKREAHAGAHGRGN